MILLSGTHQSGVGHCWSCDNREHLCFCAVTATFIYKLNNFEYTFARKDALKFYFIVRRKNSKNGTWKVEIELGLQGLPADLAAINVCFRHKTPKLV